MRVHVKMNKLFASFALAVVALLGIMAVPTTAHADYACTKACEANHSSWSPLRAGCKAKCWAADKAAAAAAAAKAAYDKVKSTAGSAYNKAKDVAKKAYDKAKDVAKKAYDTAKTAVKKVVTKVKNIAKGYWDKAKKCLADGVGGCMKKVINKVKNIAKGAWDAVKKCTADGIGGCLKKVGKAILDAGKKWLCGKAMPLLEKAAAWLLNKAGSKIAGYSLSLSTNEIGSLACAWKSQIGHVVGDHSKKLGNPTLTLSGIKLGGKAGKSGLTATLGASASVSAPKQTGALSLSVVGQVNAALDRTCNFKGPMITLSGKVAKVSISKMPQWLTNKAVSGYVNPSLGCFSFCMEPLKVQGMDIKLNICKVLDTCLKDKCTSPVLNTIIAQIFPISIPISGYLKGKALAGVKENIKGWYISIGGVKFKTNKKNPYNPSITASVAIGPSGKPKFRINATGSLALKTVCHDDGKSMIKVTPSFSLKIGEIPKWMQTDTIPNVANQYINDFINSKGGKDGVFTIPWPGFLSGKKAPPTEKEGPGLLTKLKGYYNTIKNNWDAIKQTVKTVLRGRFVGKATSCATLERTTPEASMGAACNECLKTTPVATNGYVTSSALRMRSGTSTSTKILGTYPKCTKVKILGGVTGWAKVELKGKTGYMSSKYVSKTVPQGCRP